MTLTKTIFWSLSRQTVFLQNCLTTLDFYSVAFLILLTIFFFKEFYLCMFVQFFPGFLKQKVLAFSKVAKIEGEVFVALRASQGDLEPSRATILPQSPCSLIPEGLCPPPKPHIGALPLDPTRGLGSPQTHSPLMVYGNSG